MSAPAVYDALSPNEVAPPLPSAPRVRLGTNSVLQPPLSRRGSGPGLVLILPSGGSVKRGVGEKGPPLDPEPVLKWAEEGFAVVGVTVPESQGSGGFDVKHEILEALNALRRHPKVDVGDKFGLVVYDGDVMDDVLRVSNTLDERNIASIIAFSDRIITSYSKIPLFTHITAPSEPAEPSSSPSTRAFYPNSKPHFILPFASTYDPSSANLAHTRSLVFLRKHLGGPHFDLEAIWEEHTFWEFERRSVAQTMATMVAEPYVNHVPTMTGGVGRKNLAAFYRDHFIFCNPPDTALAPISRTVGPDRVVDEFIFSCTHTSHIPWLLPNVPPSGARLAIPMVAVVNVRGDRLYHEHIWWDQATVLRQIGVMPTHLPGPTGGMLKLPVAGDECARLLVDERDGQSNQMIGEAAASSICLM